METMNINLNEQQSRAVTTTSRYVRVIAGAGSGKTRVLTMRVGYLIETLGVEPKRIVAITFTNKAANEMKKRIQDQLGVKGLGPQISTIHSLCVRILREDIRNLGYPANFTVLDQDDQKSILREAYKVRNLDVKTISFSQMLDYIADCKAMHIDYERAKELSNGFSRNLEKAEVYGYYLKRQDEMFALDFDDLLLWTVKLLKTFPQVLEKWQYRFQYILVDEFQDIDAVQYELIKLLAGSKNDVYVVGDPDQTIYTWRGANVEIIMNFEKDFKPCETILLTQNYRSSPMILNAANSLIQYNRMRVEKELFTNRTKGKKVVHYAAHSEDDEAVYIARKILEIHKKTGTYNDIAVLYRANYLSRSLEKGLRDFHIPYVIYGGIRFYDRAEVKDMLSYLRMLVTADDLAFKRVMNQPKRGLGGKAQDALFDASRKYGCTMYEAIDKAEVTKSALNSLHDFRSMIEGFKSLMGTVPLDQLLEKIFEETGYRAMLEKDKEDEKISNVKEMMNDIESFIMNYPDATLAGYLQMVNLYTEREDEMETEFVQLMTIHAAKGLEFSTVFVAGLSEGVFPSDRTIAEGLKGLEEERRLAYVAYTRAKDELYLTEPQGFSFVLSKARVASRFIKEIDDRYIEHTGNGYEFGFNRNTVTANAPSGSSGQALQAAPALKAEKYRNGDRVTHEVFGDGVVISIKGKSMDVAFPFPYGVKTLMMGHPAIHKK
ncbi:MAG: UvrD-helicase domain-containing protein [Erysipelotrichales bacterium]|nr:UvrD-helicase domain-containing protein [Erysipelotrichales bacterium]